MSHEQQIEERPSCTILSFRDYHKNTEKVKVNKSIASKDRGERLADLYEAFESLGYKQQDEVLAYAEGYVLARAGKLTLSEVFQCIVKRGIRQQVPCVLERLEERIEKVKVM